MTTAPNILNYHIGKGVVSFKVTGASVFRDLGNVPEFEWTPALDKLEHYSSRTGVKSKDRTVVLSKAGTIRVVMDEWDVENLALAMLGTISQNTAGNNVIAIFASNSITGVLKYREANEVGPKYEWIFNNVSFIPSSSVSPISEEFGQLEITGDVLVDGNGDFGTIEELSEAETDVTA